MSNSDSKMKTEEGADTDAKASVSLTDPVIIKRLDRVQRREAWVGWTQVVANILVPLALAIAGLTLLQQTWQSQRDASVRQVELFYSEGLTQAQAHLFSLWTDTDLSVLRGPQTRDFIDAFVERTIATSDKDQNTILASIVALSAYFDRVESCIESGRCNEPEIVDQIGAYGRDFYCIYAGQIKRIRVQTLASKLGDGLQRFANRNDGCVADGNDKS